jgi:hypothetical protein
VLGLLFDEAMKLMTAHRILIGTAVVFFLGFATWEFDRYLQSNDAWTLVQSVFYFFVGVGFTVYFINLKKLYR